jgi:tetratricopeptide (TPR) repeat protein
VIRAIYQQQGEMAFRDSEDMRRARQAGLTAVKLDPQLAEAHAVLAFVRMSDRDNAAAQRSFEQALKLSPNSATAQSWFGVLLLINGRIDQALERYTRAAEIDPLWFINLQNLTEALFYAGRYEDALQTSDRAIALRSDPFIPHVGLRAQILFALGRREEAVQMARGLRTNPAADTRWIADAAAIRVLNLSGQTAEAQAYAAEVLARLDSSTAVRAQVLAAVGRHREALNHLAQMRPTELRFVLFEPLWDTFRNEPEFLETMARLGCTEEYQTARATLARLKKPEATKP